MERNDIALIRRWAGEIAKEEMSGLELKLTKDIEAMNEKTDSTSLKVRAIEDAIKKVKEDMAENAEATSKDFAFMKEELTKKPQAKKAIKTVEKAIKPKYKTR
jgi:hypothetical protein